MFGVGEYVVSGNKGVCLVSEIKTLDISGTSPDDEYYILKPVYNAGSTVYVPVELAEESLRPILSRQQANDLIAEVCRIPELIIANEKQLEQEYKGCIRSNDARELVKLVKTIYARSQRRLAAGRKETSVDSKYFHLATDYLFGELSIALDVPKDKIEDLISDSGWGDPVL